jgi:pyochelin synthetase
MLSPIQRAYLVGDQDGLELRGPARYYLGCDLSPARAAGVCAGLRKLVRDNDILRVRVGADLSLSTLPAEAAMEVRVDVRWVDNADFDTANDAARGEFTSDTFEFDGWPQFTIVVVRSELRARLHLVYALWLMDAASLELFLAGLVSDPPDVRDRPAPVPGRDRSARDERFWRARTFPDPAELPLRPQWRHAGRDVSHRMVTVDALSAQRIAQTANDHALTLPMVYLAAYGVAIGRLGGGVAHTVTVLRSLRTAADALGNRGTTMPLEIPATTGQSFAEIAKEVQGRYLSQAMHGSLSGSQIARLGDPGGDLRRLPYPFAFTALAVDGAGEAGLGLRRRWDEVQLRVPQVLIDHQVIMESDGSVRLGFDWRTDAFDAGFVEDFVDQCADLVMRLASDEPWTHVPPRTPGSPTMPQRGTADDTLHDRVLRIAAERPDAPAVHDTHGTLTYAELAGHAHAVADLLLDAGARPGDRVAVHLPRGRGQVIAVLGSLIACCVYIPLDHGTPDGRVDSITRRGDVRFAITDGRQDDRWARRGATPLTLPTVASGPRHRRQNPCPTAYVIFTSGSTGEPKGVVISHAAVVNTLDAVNDELGVDERDRVLSVSSIGFDLSVYDIFGPLLRGGSVVLLSEQTARDPSAWVDLIERHGVTVWNSAPALASLLAEERAATPSVRAFLLSGDWIPLTLPASLRRLAPAGEVISLGGATEGSIWSIFHRVIDADCAGRSIPYGKPLAGQDILVLDASRRVCRDWHIGEIHIAGAGVADGYLNDPAKTEAAFVDDPVFGWIYRTGDRGRRLPGGIVEFLGRTDTQVKLNGHRVELGEIEHLLEGLASIRRCAAGVRGDGRRKRVVAYVSLTPDAADTWRPDAYAALKDALPQYMVPEAIVELDEIPLTSNGKLDRRRLDAVPIDDAPVDKAQCGQDLHEQEVALCWREVLGEPPGGGNFFESGGGSYDAIRLLSLLRGRFGYCVSFGEFMADPTVSGLASHCRRARVSDNPGIWTFRPRSVATPRMRLVLFPPVGGGVSCYSGLIRDLSVDIDVHVVGFDGPVEPTDLAGLARLCVEQLPAQAMADDVPRVFAGWSFGGALAFEAARIVPAARVVVVDTPVSAGSRGDEPEFDGFVRDIEKTSGVIIERTDPTLGTRFDVYRQNMTLLGDWVPEPLNVPVIEFRAAESPAEQDVEAWGRVARVEDAVMLTGGHFAVFDGDNARRVRTAIEDVKP